MDRAIAWDAVASKTRAQHDTELVDKPFFCGGTQKTKLFSQIIVIMLERRFETPYSIRQN
jgi:hypothetical protein